MHNIEKSSFRRGAYVGYGGGAVWHITRNGRQWRAAPINWIRETTLAPFSMRTLRDISAELAALPLVA